MSRSVREVSRAVVYSTFALSLIGLGISGYLTFTHFEGSRYLACSTTGLFNCDTVTTSPESYLFGAPVALIGLVGYVVIVALNSPWAWHSPRYALHLARVVVVSGSMAFVLWLIAAELLYVGHVCEWCSGVHAVTFVLFVILARVAPGQLGRDSTPRETAPL